MSRARSGKKRVPAKDAARAKDAVRAEVRALVHGPSYMTFEDDNNPIVGGRSRSLSR